STATKAARFEELVTGAIESDARGRPSRMSALVDQNEKLTDQAVDAIAMLPASSAAARPLVMKAPTSSASSQTHQPSGWIPAAILTACIPPNPMLRALRLRADANLYKIRTCRNIAGLNRELEAYAAPTDTSTGMPSIGAGGALVVPGLNAPR